MPSPPSPGEFAELERQFHQAVALPVGERAAFVVGLRARSPGLADRLASLLAADGGEDSVGRLVADEARAVAGDEALVGERFGAYVLDRVLGRGGMGAVYLGRRADGAFEHDVAIKTIPSGLASAQVLERFGRERAILARLNHPGIARLLDGGAGPRGVPFVVMELVTGAPITRYAADTHAGLRRRLELFLELCDAVEFVHRNLVVHRDLKPGNVLVAADGHVKLLDFGIAKLADQFEAQDAPTATGQRMMTPEYASPEQVLGLPVTTSTDIYALGVLLYELLTGERPLRFSSTSPFELAQEIVSRTPAPPSEAAGRGASAGGQAPEPAGYARRLRGDLDRIVMMAMRKEPDRRYPSVAALASDVRAWLAGRPVAAQTDTWGYRARKAVGRHPVASGAALLVGATVIGFTTLTVRQSRVIREERDHAVVAARRATATSGFLVKLFEAADPREPGTRNLTAFELLQAGVKHLRADTTLTPEVRADLFLTLGLSLSNLEAFDAGIESLRASIAESERAYGRDSLETAERLHRLGDVLRRANRLDEALVNLTEAIEIRRRHQAGDSYEIADSYNNLAVLAIAMGQYVESERLQLESVAMHARLAADQGVPINNLALLERRQGRYAEALALATRAYDILQKTEDRDSARLARLNIARIRKAMGDVDGAEQLYEAVLGPARAELGPAHSRVFSIELDLARCLRARGEYDEARRRYDDLGPRIDKALGAPSVMAALVLRDRGLLDLARGRPAEAEPRLRAALAMHLQVLSPRHFRVPSFRRGLAQALAANGKLGEAEGQLREILTLFPDSKIYPHIEVSNALTTLAEVLRLAGRSEEARSALGEARDIIARTAGEKSLEMERARAELRRLDEAGSRAGRVSTP